MEQGEPGRAGPDADHGRDGPDHHRAREEGLHLEQVGGAAGGRGDRIVIIHQCATAAAAGDACTGRKRSHSLNLD